MTERDPQQDLAAPVWAAVASELQMRCHPQADTAQQQIGIIVNLDASHPWQQGMPDCGMRAVGTTLPGQRE